MRQAALFCAVGLLFVGCGSDSGSQSATKAPASLAGNWAVAITGVCTGTMALTQADGSISGNWACGGTSGTMTGSYGSPPAISLTSHVPGYADALVTGTVSDGTKIAGQINGSGFTGQAFTATKT